MDKLAVLGNPIEHSLSPLIFNQFAQKMGKTLQYEKLLVAVDEFEQTVDKLAKENYRAINITAPFKPQAFAIADQYDDMAKLSGVANGIIFQEDGRMLATNTDGIGLVNDISRILTTNINNKSILLIGAGGASKGCLPALLQTQPKTLVICNRTESKAEELANKYANQNVQANNTEQLEQTFDIIINATTASIAQQIPTIPEHCIHSQTLCYDMKYGDAAKPFLHWAHNLGATTADGLGMLLEQAKENFRLWFGIIPDYDLAQLHQLLAK